MNYLVLASFGFQHRFILRSAVVQPSYERPVEIPAVNIFRDEIHQNEGGCVDSQKS
jgi:hypothetical protein